MLAPYLLAVKKLPPDEAFDVIKGWLLRCNELRRLDSSFDSRIRYALADAARKGIPPMRLDTLEQRYRALYDQLRVPKQQ
jgi:hypothetical protein